MSTPSADAIGLVDGNNFYASVERAFDPRLIGRPVVVLSSNDGAAIARSAEAKQLGIKMGQPLHEIPAAIRRQVAFRSANFRLYGDISSRIGVILEDLFPQVERYSIDELFVGFQGIKDRECAAAEARARILQWTGVPCCVGIGSTKTLAKLANKLAKTDPTGVLDICEPGLRISHLAGFPVGDVWGVGRKYADRLGAEGINTAEELAAADPDGIRSRYGVVLSRTQRELQGLACLEMEDVEPDRKQIVVSRSFGRDVTSKEDVGNALATFAIRGAEKMRARGLHAGGVWVWLNTNPFRQVRQYHPSRTRHFAIPTSDTREILALVSAMLDDMYRPGLSFKKAGIGLVDLTSMGHSQTDLFAQASPRDDRLMQVLDQANRRFGRGTMGFAASGWKAQPAWRVKQEHVSPAYTSSWDQLIKVK